MARIALIPSFDWPHKCWGMKSFSSLSVEVFSPNFFKLDTEIADVINFLKDAEIFLLLFKQKKFYSFEKKTKKNASCDRTTVASLKKTATRTSFLSGDIPRLVHPLTPSKSPLPLVSWFPPGFSVPPGFSAPPGSPHVSVSLHSSAVVYVSGCLRAPCNLIGQ